MAILAPTASPASPGARGRPQVRPANLLARPRPCSSLRKLSSLGLGLAAGILGGIVLNPPVQAQSPSEYQIKAAFLYNFAKFIEWPPEAFADSSAPIVIGILGDDPFGVALEETVRGKTINGRALLIKRFKRSQEPTDCQILFISSSERKRLRSIFDNLKATGVLTVGETETFPRLGGVINFILEDNRVHFEVNVDAAERAHLKISSKLLGLAKIVRDGDHGGRA